MKPHELFKQVDPAVVTELFTAFREEERDVYKSALASLAQSRKLRPVFIQKKPVPQQIAWMHKTLTLRGSDMVGENLLQVWFMKFQQPLLVKFCDGMGISHNGEGSVEGELPSELDAGKLKETVDALYAEFNPRVVSLYLHVFNMQRPGGWDSLAEVLSGDERVILGKEPETKDRQEAPGEAVPATEQVAGTENGEDSESEPAQEAAGEEAPADEPRAVGEDGNGEADEGREG